MAQASLKLAIQPDDLERLLFPFPQATLFSFETGSCHIALAKPTILLPLLLGLRIVPGCSYISVGDRLKGIYVSVSR